MFQVKKFGTGTWSVLKFYTCLAKGLKLKLIKFGEPILTLVEVTEEKRVGGGGGGGGGGGLIVTHPKISATVPM